MNSELISGSPALRRNGQAMSLWNWLNTPSTTTGLHVSDGRRWNFTSYQAIARDVLRRAEVLRAHGAKPGDRVLLEASSASGFVANFFGTVVVGATPVPIPPQKVAAGATGDASPDLRETFGDCLVLGLSSSLGIDVGRVLETSPDVEPFDGSPVQIDGWLPPEVALIQMTSGSTGTRRALEISRSALESQVAAIHTLMEWGPEDSATTWLPFYHDMGLVGTLLTSVAAQADLRVLPPSVFVRRPRLWLEAMSVSQTSAAAPFGLAHVLKYLRPEHLEGLHLSGVSGIVIGAERLDPELLTEFVQRLEPAGLCASAALPAYGLAEGTLAVTAKPLRSQMRVQVSSPSHTSGQVLSCGTPLQGVAVSIMNEDGLAVADNVVGSIHISSDSLASAYINGETREPIGETLDTGDVGFLADGELFVLGRLQDAVQGNNSLVFAEDIELALRLDRRRLIVALGTISDTPTCVIYVDEKLELDTVDVQETLSSIDPSLDLVVERVPRRTLSFTSSGKPRRSHMWALSESYEVNDYETDPPTDCSMVGVTT